MNDDPRPAPTRWPATCPARPGPAPTMLPAVLRQWSKHSPATTPTPTSAVRYPVHISLLDRSIHRRRCGPTPARHRPGVRGWCPIEVFACSDTRPPLRRSCTSVLPNPRIQTFARRDERHNTHTQRERPTQPAHRSIRRRRCGPRWPSPALKSRNGPRTAPAADAKPRDQCRLAPRPGLQTEFSA